MTLVPSPCNCSLHERPALSPIETIVVTAAMPMTTPSTVSPAQILFLAKARRATRRVRRRFMNSNACCQPTSGTRETPADFSNQLIRNLHMSGTQLPFHQFADSSRASASVPHA